jgi:PAS domain S-box-containing protein
MRHVGKPAIVTERASGNRVPESLSIPDADIERALRRLLLDNLGLIAGVASALYAVYAIGHHFVLPAHAITMSLVASFTALMLAALALRLHRHRPAEKWTYPLAAVVGVAALLNTLVHLYLLADPQETTNVMLVVIAAGFLLFSSPWFAAIVLLALLGWGEVAWIVQMPSPAFRHFGSALLTSAVLATLIHVVWGRALRRLHSMRLRDEVRTAELAAALEGSEAGRQALEVSKRELEDMVQAVEESEARFLRFTDLEGMAVHDRGVILEANPMLARMFGYELAEIIGRNVIDVIAAESRASVLARLRSDDETPYEAIGVTRDGRRLPLELSGKSVAYHAHKVGVVIVRDITERKRAEAALRDSEARFRQLADAMPQIVWSARPDGEIDYWNRRWYELVGSLPGNLDARSWRAVLHPDDVQLADPRWRRAVQSGETYEVEYRFRDPTTGGYRWYLTRGLPVRDENGTIVRWFGTSTDIDDQKRNAQALEDANRQKDEFLAMLAHELRNPLAPIRNSVHLLRVLGPPAPRAEKAYAVIDRQVTHLVRLVDDLLDVSRISRGKTLLKKQRLDLVQLVRTAAEDHRFQVNAAGLALSVDVPDGRLWIVGDATRLAQVIGNLLDNAIKFTDPGGRISVSLATSPGDAQASIRVRDTGIGMEAELLERIFDTFTQADRTLARSRGGMGLGLALVRGLVQLHGGEVRATSAGLGQGAEFEIRLPVEPGVAVPLEPVGPPPTVRRSRRVLVIEDNTDCAGSMQQLLELSGHEVTVAPAGEPGVEAARRFHPDVVLCDIGLPGDMDGYAVARALRQDAAFRATYLVALTGYGQEEDCRRSREAGFDVHLTKPIDPVYLEALLANGTPQ